MDCSIQKRDAQTLNVFLENVIKTSKGWSNSIDIDDGSQFVIKIFTVS